MTEINENIKINYKFSWLTEVLEWDIKDLIKKNINWKLDRYLQKILSKNDAEVHLDVDLGKNKQEKYEWSFRFLLDWKSYIYKNDVPFKNITDLVNHAFDHLKRELSDK